MNKTQGIIDRKAYIKSLSYNEQLPFKDGGLIDEYTDSVITKVYVSIRVESNIVKNPIKTIYRTEYEYANKVFNELSNFKLNGVIGVSTNKWNVSNWFHFRDCLIVMDFKKFKELNNATQVLYNDPDYLMANDMEVLLRLSDRKNNDIESKIDIIHNFSRYLVAEFGLVKTDSPSLNKEWANLEYAIDRYKSHSFTNYIRRINPTINSPKDFANVMLDYVKDPEEKKNLMFPSDLTNQLTADDIVPIIELGVKRQGSIFQDEGEWILEDKTLNIPKDSQLFFKESFDYHSQLTPFWYDSEKKIRQQQSNKGIVLKEKISEYNLYDKYKVHFVMTKHVERYAHQQLKVKENIFNERLEERKKELNQKKLDTFEIIKDVIVDDFSKYIESVLEKKDDGSLETYRHIDTEWEDDNPYPHKFTELPLYQELFDEIDICIRTTVNENAKKPITEITGWNISEVIKNDITRCLELQNKKLASILEQQYNYQTSSSYESNNQWYDIIRFFSATYYEEGLYNGEKYKSIYKNEIKGETHRLYDKKDIWKFKEGGKAPYKSNLTPEQQKLVRTPEFKEWFGDWENSPETASKIVDENGEPLVLNHSTRKYTKEDGSYEDYFNIDSWLQERGNYLFSTPNSSVNPIFLSRKGKYALSDDIWQIKFFANIKNLFDTDNKNHLKKLQEYTIKTYSKYGDYNEMAEDLYGGGYETFEVDYKIGEKRNKWENSGSIPALISEMGYDAYINNDENVIVVFDRNKLKLADGSNTTFDSNNPDIRFAYGGKVYKSRLMIPNVRGGWTKQKIINYLKTWGSDVVSTPTLAKYISEFDNWEELKKHIYYHGTTNYIEKSLYPSIKFSERWAEQQGGGGYGERYFGISLTKRKRTAEAFSGNESSVTIYPIILKRDAKVIERTDLEDASDIEDIIVELYENGVDAVWIGGGEEELVVVNPRSIILYKKGKEHHQAFGGFKSIALTDEDIKEMYDLSFKTWEHYSENISKFTNKEERNDFVRSIPNIMFKEGGVTSDKFKKWFGDSKVVDKKGSPLVVYHGSPDLRGLKENYIFESRFLDNQSFFFTDNYSMAKSYADPQRAFDYQNSEEGVIRLYLSLQNPLIVNSFNQIWRKFETTIDGNEIVGTRNLITFAKNKGYDGVIVKNVRDYYNGNEKKIKGGNVYVAFEPEQIKLADGSNTTFDSNNPDIRFAYGGQNNAQSIEEIHKDKRGEYLYVDNGIVIQNLFHGTCKPFRKFNDSKKGISTADDLMSLLGFSFSPSIDKVFEHFAGYERYSQEQEQYAVDECGKEFTEEQREENEDEWFDCISELKYNAPTDCRAITVNLTGKKVFATSETDLWKYGFRLLEKSGELNKLEKQAEELIINNRTFEPTFRYHEAKKNNWVIDTNEYYGSTWKELRVAMANAIWKELLIKGYDIIKYINEVEIDNNEPFDYIPYSTKQIKPLERIYDGEFMDFEILDYKKGGQPTNFWGNSGSGVLLKAKDTGRYLILKRSDWVNEPNTWGLISGKTDGNESPIQTAQRELAEETGFLINKKDLEPSYVYQNGDFKFYNFIGTVDNEFEPALDWENTDFVWTELDKLPTPIHFGLKELIANKFKQGGKASKVDAKELKIVLEKPKEDEYKNIEKDMFKLKQKGLGFGDVEYNKLIKQRAEKEYPKKTAQTEELEEGGIVEGQLHSECNDDTGCGEKFDVGGSGHIIEVERDEAVIVSSAFDDNGNYEIEGTPSQIASAINSIGGGKDFDGGAKVNGSQLKNTKITSDNDVDEIDGNSIIINRRSMYDTKNYKAKGNLKQISSLINNIDDNGVKITEGGSIEEL